MQIELLNFDDIDPNVSDAHKSNMPEATPSHIDSYKNDYLIFSKMSNRTV